MALPPAPPNPTTRHRPHARPESTATPPEPESCSEKPSGPHLKHATAARRLRSSPSAAAGARSFSSITTAICLAFGSSNIRFERRPTRSRPHAHQPATPAHCQSPSASNSARSRPQQHDRATADRSRPPRRKRRINLPPRREQQRFVGSCRTAAPRQPRRGFVTRRTSPAIAHGPPESETLNAANFHASKEHREKLCRANAGATPPCSATAPRP